MGEKQRTNPYYKIIKSLSRRFMFEDRKQARNRHPQPEKNQTSTQQNAPNIESLNEQKRANRISVIANRISNRSNKISKFSAFINGALFAPTLIVILLNKKSIDIAKEAIQMQRSNDSANRVHERFKDSTDSIVRGKTLASIDSSFSFNRRNLNQQIRSLNETKKEFELENRPFVQITDLVFDTLKINKKIQASFSVVNLGKFPAKIIDAKYKFIFMPVTAQDTIDRMGVYSYVDTNYILGSGLKINHHVSTADPIPQDILNQIKAGNVAGYLIGTCRYLNISNGRKYFSSFIYKMSISPIGYTETIIKNKEVEL